MPTEATVNEIINNALATADAQTAAASAAAQEAITASEGYAIAAVSPVVATITAVEPAVGLVEDSTLTYEAQLDKIIALLSDELAAYFIKYYPIASDAFDEATNWLVNSITVGGTGISATVENQIWQRARERVVTDGARVEAQAISEFASRGFSLPPGSLAGRLQEIKFEQLTKTSELSRDVGIEQAKMEIENVRFAVELALKSRAQALAAAADYLRAVMSGADTSAKVASINSEAQARMIAATADLYRARLSRDQIALGVATSNASNSLQLSTVNMDGFYKGIDARVRAAAAAAAVYGQSAQGALASLSSVASVSAASFT